VSLSKAIGLPNDPRRVRPEHVVDWVARHLDDEADAVFLSGNGLRAAGAIEELERVTGQLVLEANQVMLWSILAVTRTAWEIAGYGRLFGVSPSSTT
jgi:maleate isomerase